MLIITSGFVAGPGAPHPAIDPALVTDILWAFSPLSDGLEHIRSRGTAGRVDLVFFYLAGDTQKAVSDKARALCLTALSRSPLLQGWHLMGEEDGPP